ncbi:hypothetical protein P3T37_003141 [Kitasatospora sp. MAA4]|uniref:hypothetical protein n=1 Tax=Kitasatospora sp. MAA4 TaxID=3035093 RepID=UPI002476090C|nr:hypothetical protein [Kitasatospora sp. MAA4]MDH6133743.1 hypothetical protein [Kitasatospora sp. MAA4]
MDRSTLTELYLAQVRAHGAVASELIGRQSEIELLTRNYRTGFLSRPLFLGHQEREQLTADLAVFRGALLSLPDKLFDGDLGAFARAAGMAEVQVDAMLRSRGNSLTRMTRSDLCVDESGFRLLEANMSSALGGMDNAVMARALLEHPVLADFAEQHNLGVLDSMGELVRTMYAETGFAPDATPVVAMADWPSSYLNSFGPYLEEYCAHLQAMGVDAHPCHIGQFEYRDGRVWLGERAVDIILRIFINEDLLESPEAAAVMDPVLNAAAAGQVHLFAPLDAELFASKAALAMLSDERNRHLFSPEELAVLDRLLPWTRMLRPGSVTLEDGSRVDLLQYALTHQEELALKPTVSSGGSGIVLGWDAALTPQQWHEQLTAALDGPYVLQRRIRPVTELFPDENGELQPWLIVWGVFTMANGFAGVMARGTLLEDGVGVVNIANGALAGTALYELAPATRS